jgi:serine/threonine protein kinase
MAETGQRVGDYEVIAPLGAGGMGRVYKVRNVISNREEAMKILLPDFAADPDLAARFMAEIRTLAGLDHPGIAQLRTAFQHNNQFVMVMEYVEGTTLEKLAEQTRIPLDHILDFSMQVLAALSYAHGKGVTHRDIKPANIMITTHGVIKLMDFGIAKSTGDMQLTRPGSTMGSVYYMSPEQVRSDSVDGRSDLYSFGVTLYEMLTGRKPFVADTSYSVLNAQLNQAPTPPLELNPAIPPALNDIVLRAMAKRPEDRFQTAEEFRSALRASADPQTAAIPQPMIAGATPIPQPPQFSTQPPPYATQPQAYATEQQYVAPQPPPFTPVAKPVPPPGGAAPPRRGLWIGLGAATALIALIAVASLLPRIFSTHASPKPPVVATDTPPSTPTAPPASSTPAPTPPVETPSSTEPTASTPGGTAQKPAPSRPVAPSHAPDTSHQAGSKPVREPYVSPSGPTPAGTTSSADHSQAPAAGPSPREMREARDRYANLEARADSALAGVEQIRSQQRAQGLDLRGDIITAINRLHHQLDQSRQALAERDLETANEYMNRADSETSNLEKFLGR